MLQTASYQKNWEGENFETPVDGILVAYAIQNGLLKTVRVRMKELTSGDVIFEILHEGISIGSVTIPAGSTAGISSTLDVSVLEFEEIVLNLVSVPSGSIVKAPIAMQLKIIETPSAQPIFDAINTDISHVSGIKQKSDKIPLYSASDSLGKFAYPYELVTQLPVPTPIPNTAGVVDTSAVEDSIFSINTSGTVNEFTIGLGKVFTVQATSNYTLHHDGDKINIPGGKDYPVKTGDIYKIWAQSVANKVVVFAQSRQQGIDSLGYGVGQIHADPITGVIKIGDMDSTGHHTTIEINDPAQFILMQSYNFFGALGASLLFSGILKELSVAVTTMILNCKDGQAILGSNTDGNGTKLHITDSTKTIDITADEGFSVNKALLLTPVPYADLPSSPVEGMIAKISDSTTKARGCVIAGSGTFLVTGKYEGSAWYVLDGGTPDVVLIKDTDSPYTLTADQSGKVVKVDSKDADVTVVLPDTNLIEGETCFWIHQSAQGNAHRCYVTTSGAEWFSNNQTATMNSDKDIDNVFVLYIGFIDNTATHGNWLVMTPDGGKFL
jgi:hypothetical protein